MALIKSKLSPVSVGKDGFVYADGVKIGRQGSGPGLIQFFDRDKRRCQEKGRQVVEVSISDLANLPKQ